MQTLSVPVTTGGTGTADLVTTEGDASYLLSNCSEATPAKYKGLATRAGTYIDNIITFHNRIGGISNFDPAGIIELSPTAIPPASAEHIAIDTFLTKLEGPKKLQYELAVICSEERKQVDLKGLNAQKQAMEESKLRLDGIRNSDTQVSYYEGWFPLFRPMSETSLFTVFSISIALLLVSIVAFLRMQGIELQILTPVSNFDFMATLRGYSSYIWAAIAVGLGIAFTATKMNWV